ncbi:hypothetical protein ACNQKP_10885 [Bdellovibrio bacteriovorus]|uniref:hypothetical protein n=1 Tax=Bdellovibrio bacteriovorus TaxID=959 RepID=UPI003AA90B13
MLVGVDENTHLIYQGQNKAVSYALWPLPLLLPVKIAGIFESSAGATSTGLAGAEMIFREDFFDPITRIRKGRLYRVGNLERWITPLHPMGDIPVSYGAPIVVKQRDLRTCTPVNFPVELNGKSVRQIKLVLGNSVAATSWTISSWERTSTNEDLLTLRASISYGALPLLTLGAISEVEKKLIEDEYKNLEDSLFVSSPESIVDCCRDLCESVLLAKIRTVDMQYQDAEIGKSIKKFSEIFKNEFKNVLNHAQVLQIYHPRRKLEEKVKRDLRAATSQDAELCVLSVGAIICDLGYGTWG